MKIKVTESREGEFDSSSLEDVKEKIDIAVGQVISTLFGETCGGHGFGDHVHKAMGSSRGGEMQILEDLTQLTKSHYERRMGYLKSAIEQLVSDAISEGIED